MRIIYFIFLFHLSINLSAQIVGTFAGIRDEIGAQDGTTQEATFNNPHGIAISQSGNLYVTDRFNHSIRKITPNGIVSTLAGNPGMIGDVDGFGTTALFYEPWGICVDANENVFVADTRNNKIRKITPDGEVTTYAGTGNYGTTNSSFGNSTFGQPVGIEIDDSGNIYVADHGTHIIRKISIDGNVSTLAGVPYITGDADGDPTVATFNRPYGLTLDLQGNILVADEWNHKIRRITPQGDVSTVAGIGIEGGDDGDASNATFKFPWDVTVDSAGIIYVADGLNSAIRKIIPEGNIEVTTLAGTIGSAGNQDGIGTNARFSGATGVAFSPLTREVFVADAFNNLIRKITDLDQGVFLNLDYGVTSICPYQSLEVRAYPDVFEQYHFYLDGEYLATSETPNFDTIGISSGIHNISVLAELDTFQANSINFEFEIFELNPASINIVGNTTFFDGDSVVFIASFGESYFWSDGSDTPTLTVREAGIYTVEVTDENGCSSISDPIEVIVRFDPDAINILYEGETHLCSGEEVELKTNQKENIQWIKDNWPIQGATDTLFVANSSGVYRVQYTAEEGVVVISDAIEIVVSPEVDLEFRSDRLTAKPGEEVQFIALNENLSELKWNFGDPSSGVQNTSSLRDPIHRFEESGVYEISLFGMDENGCGDTLTKPEYLSIFRNADPRQNDDDIFVATAFTPNGDGENDVLFVRGSDVVSLSFKVYSERGQLVFESSEKAFGWDGRFKNDKSPIGNYVFQLNYTNHLGIEKMTTGIVTLIR